MSMVPIFENEWIAEDGSHCRMTVSTQDGEPLSGEDQAFIRRLLPLAAENMLEAAAPDQDK
jgi:hypothetical protein